MLPYQLADQWMLASTTPISTGMLADCHLSSDDPHYGHKDNCHSTHRSCTVVEHTPQHALYQVRHRQSGVSPSPLSCASSHHGLSQSSSPSSGLQKDCVQAADMLWANHGAGEGQFYCGICPSGRTFNSRATLKKHIQYCHQEKPLCPYCKTGIRADNMSRHIKRYCSKGPKGKSRGDLAPSSQSGSSFHELKLAAMKGTSSILEYDDDTLSGNPLACVAMPATNSIFPRVVFEANTLDTDQNSSDGDLYKLVALSSVAATRQEMHENARDTHGKCAVAPRPQLGDEPTAAIALPSIRTTDWVENVFKKEVIWPQPCISPVYQYQSSFPLASKWEGTLSAFSPFPSLSPVTMADPGQDITSNSGLRRDLELIGSTNSPTALPPLFQLSISPSASISADYHIGLCAEVYSDTTDSSSSNTKSYAMRPASESYRSVHSHLYYDYGNLSGTMVHGRIQDSQGLQ